MSTSTFDAIHKISEKLKEEGKGETIVLILPGKKIVGKLACGNSLDCFENVVTLKDVQIHCHASGHTKELEWLNVVAKHVLAFTFSDCEPGCECGCQG